jgi:hypothetical protein
MKRLFFLLCLIGLLMTGDDSRGGPIVPFVEAKTDLPPLASRNFTVEFRDSQRATVLARGDGSTFLGLYVYDAQGNCIAWDDQGNSPTCDDLAVSWQPRENGYYSIEVRNAGYVKNNCLVGMR